MNTGLIKLLMSVFLILGMFVSGNVAQGENVGKPLEKGLTNVSTSLDGAGKWFSAWEFVSRDIYKINNLKTVEFVFFDEKYVYSTSVVSLPKGELIDGPGLFGKKMIWRRDIHNGKITLPNGQIVPVGLMSFAAPLDEKDESAFFVMPLPEFWEKAGVKSEEFGLEKLLTGVFLHEFSHTQQVSNFGRKISEYEKQYNFDVEFSDDIVQDYFGKDALYESVFREEEVEIFYKAAAIKDRRKSVGLIKQAIESLESRQRKYFSGDKEHFREIDDFFLTMEGFGQMTMYLWLIDPKGGNISPELAVKGVRRGKKSWSQDEGFALFLVLNKFSKPKKWSKKMSGDETESIVKLLKEELKKH